MQRKFGKKANREILKFYEGIGVNLLIFMSLNHINNELQLHLSCNSQISIGNA